MNHHPLSVTAFAGILKELNIASITLSLLVLYLSSSICLGSTYTTNFPLTENPISEGGHWTSGGVYKSNGGAGNISTTHGFAQGTPHGTQSGGDPVAALTGTWGPSQTAQATVYAPGPIGTGPEVEVHLHKTITPTSNLGYEILHSITGSGSGDYMLIVKGITTPPYYKILFTNVGPRYSVKTGDVVKATIAGNVIISYKNGVQDGQVTDPNLTTGGSPGFGFNGGTTNGTYGISSFSASDTGTSTLPDLIVTSLSYNTATGVFSSIVKNQGKAATPAGVFVGVGYSVDGVQKTWGGVNGPLAAGASVTIDSSSGGGAYAVPSGTHTITAFVDDVNRIAESNETNNTLSQSITVP